MVKSTHFVQRFMNKNRDKIIEFTELAKHILGTIIDKATLSGHNSCIYNLGGDVPHEYISDVAAFLKQKFTKLGYKVKKVDNNLLVGWEN